MNENLDPKNQEILLLNPNLGHPLILNIDSKFSQENFSIDMLFATQIAELEKFTEIIQHKISIIPILEYTWKIQSLLAKENKAWLLTLLGKKKVSLWDKVKSFFLKKKRERIKQELLKNPLEFIDSQGNKFYFPEKGKFQKVKARTFRTSEIDPIISNVESVNMCDLDSLEYDNYCSPRNYLIKQDILGVLKVFYKVQIKFDINNEIKEFLESHNFIMFDLKVHFINDESKINYHSIVISKNSWNDLKIVQASDLHLAERNDRIYEIVKNWTSLVRKSEIGEIISEGVKTISFFQRLFSTKTKKASTERSITPLHKRYINPNNNFRKFIKLMNKRVLANDLDFVVLTGDLIDFAILSKIPKDVRKVVDFEYERSNWRVFKEILLNFPQEKKRGMIRGEEVLFPIFTIPGNHEYRPFHYDIRWGGLYRKIGLNGNEALALNDELMANPISSITKTFRAMKAYLTEINSSLDFFLKLGKNNLIFLNTGSDSFKRIMDFVSGHPSVTGLSNKQIKYLEHLVNKNFGKEDLNLLFLHGPPINPKHTISIFKRIDLPKHKDEILTKIDEYMESRVLMLGKKRSAARIDGKFDVKYGVVSSNWEKLIYFCKNHCILTLCGHTHQLKEFKLGDPSEDASENLQNSPLPIEKIENPAAIYYDLYSEMYTSAKEIEENGPFIVQTPALGLGSYFNPKLSGAYREIEIKDGKLVSFKVKTIKK